MAFRVDVFHRTVRRNDAPIQFVVRSLAGCVLDDFNSPGPIVWMNPLEQCFEGRHPLCRIEAEYAEVFLRPVDDLSGGDVECPTACVAQPLCFS